MARVSARRDMYPGFGVSRLKRWDRVCTGIIVDHNNRAAGELDDGRYFFYANRKCKKPAALAAQAREARCDIGFVYSGEYRPPKKGEFHHSFRRDHPVMHDVILAEEDDHVNRWIMTPIKLLATVHEPDDAPLTVTWRSLGEFDLWQG